MAMIIGSGASTGLLAMKLVKAGIPATILEKGPYMEPKEFFEKCTEEKIYDITTDESILIPISSEFNKAESDAKVCELDSTISKGITQFIDISKSKNLTSSIISKAMDGLGKEYVKAGFDYALTILNNVENIEIVAKEGNIVGVKYTKDGHDRLKYTKTVIITADGMDSKLLLKDIGIETKNIIYNPGVTVSATLKNIDLTDGCPLNVIIKGDNFTLLPYTLETEENKLCILVKSEIEEETDDEFVANESLNEGIEIVKEILAEMNAQDIEVSEVRGINTRGNAPIGEIVNDELETEINGLFICDSSINKENTSVTQLAKKLADYLENIDYDNNQFGKSDYGLGKSYGKMDGWWREPPKE